MTSGDIDKILYRHFANYDYKLFNTFVFGGWECDFFAQSSSGYFIEVEIKVSRGDFFVDFKKDKHKVFTDLFDKKLLSVRKTGYNNRGDIILKNFSCPQFHLSGYRSIARGYSQIMNGSEELIEYSYGGPKRFIVNDWSFNRVHIEKSRPKDLYAPATSIEYIDLRERNYPNQFWYAVPTDMVKVEEIPIYAGLIFCDENGGSRIIKKAPFLHKRKLNLTSILLKKYYNLWQYHVGREQKFELLKEKTLSDES